MPTALSRLVPGPAKDTLRVASQHVGQSTRRLRRLPTFLIVGAQRCGTTSLFKALVQHPEVSGPTWRKGVHYFDIAHEEGLEWYRGHFPLRRSPGRRTPSQVGESSPYYLFHPLAAQRIAESLPQVRIVVMLRDPVERACSAHAHEAARAFETEPFTRALELEPFRLEGEEERLIADPRARSLAHQHHAYLRRGRYIDQLLRFERHVGRTRLHIVDSARFFADPHAEFARIQGFLGIEHHGRIRFERHNARTRENLDPVLRRRLEAYFAPYNARLAEWLGWTPSWCR